MRLLETVSGTIEIAAVGHEDPKDNGIGHTHNSGKPGSLKAKMVEISGRIYDSCNRNISYRRQFFVYTKSRFQRSFGDGEIAGVLSGTQGGIYSNQKTVRVAQFYFFYGFAQI